MKLGKKTKTERVYCKNTYLDMTDFLIETLTGYNEIQIF